MASDLDERLRLALSRKAPGSSDFDLNPDTVLPEGRVLRPAGVLVALSDVATGEPAVLLTKRSSALKHHPGQIAFPGGKQDAGDTDLADTALREAEEEVGLPRDMVQIIGSMPAHETVTGFRVEPVLARVTGEFTIRPEAGEVDEAFWVPFRHLTNPDSFQVQGRRWRGQIRHYYTVPFGPYYIWGATARILRALAERMS